MITEITWNGSVLTIAVDGRITTVTAPQLEDDINSNLDQADELVLDLGKVDYISSAGLRVLLATYKKMLGKGGVRLSNVSEMVAEILEVTGFTEIFDLGERDV